MKEKTTSNRSHMFGDLPHYYDDKFTDEKSLGGLFVKELCPVCKAHLSHSGICLNACHLGKSGQERFVKMMVEAQRRVEESE